MERTPSLDPTTFYAPNFDKASRKIYFANAGRSLGGLNMVGRIRPASRKCKRKIYNFLTSRPSGLACNLPVTASTRGASKLTR
jgi:hypothetical protein